jgi:hypothetical protein
MRCNDSRTNAFATGVSVKGFLCVAYRSAKTYKSLQGLHFKRSLVAGSSLGRWQRKLHIVRFIGDDKVRTGQCFYLVGLKG